MKKLRILHIDDNIHDRMLVRDALEREHDQFEVVEADSRVKFEKYLSEFDFDLVLSDFNILGFDGLQVLKVVKDNKPDIPVIIVTGTGSEEIAIQAMKMGASDYVIKSVNHIKGLAHTIQMVILNKSIQDERNLAIAAQKESENIYHSIFKNTSVAILLTTQDGHVLSANDFACKLFQRTESEICMTGRAGLVDITDIRLKDLLEERRISSHASGELTFIKKDGTKFQAEVSSAIFRDKDDQEKTTLVIRDLTERKLAERQLIISKEKAEESDRLKTAFLHNISHEIRTPMNAIIGFSNLLKDPDLLADKRNVFTDIIINSSNQLLSIITDIIDIATIEAGQEKVHEKEVNTNALLRILYDQFVLKTQNTDIILSFKTQLSDIDSNITCDEVKLTAVLSNLIGNAVKFTNQGTIDFGYVQKEGFLEFYVKDTGIGIAQEMYDEIFKRFRQVDLSEKRLSGGSGLGLSISKDYVEMLGGRIWLTSYPNKGSTFYFTIPYKKKISDSSSNEKSINMLNILDKTIKTILIAEDEESNFHLLVELLSDFNFNIVRAKNGLEAVRICKSNSHIDFVLMDIKMPEMDGYQASKQIKIFCPELPILAQSAYINESDRKKAIDSGCYDFISKPIDKNILFAKIMYKKS